jgi:hypothetical protein
MAMILDLGESQALFEVIRVTADYSNAVLVAILPHISDVAQKLDLPVTKPVTAEHVTHCSVVPNRRIEAEIGINGGWFFQFNFGFVKVIQGPHEFFTMQNPDKISEYYGTVRMSKTEAIQLARDTIKKLDIPLESVFAEQEPRVTEPIRIGTNTVPHYRIEWLKPTSATVGAVDIDIDADARRVERIAFSPLTSLVRSPPKVSVVPPHDPRFPSPVPPRINPEYARRLIPIILCAIDDYGQKLSLAIPRPLTTNHVARVQLNENLGGPYCELELTNGWRFLYEHDMVTAYYAPDVLLGGDSTRPILMKDLVGKWKLTEAQAIELVKRTVAKLGYPANLVHFEVEPQVRKPAVPGIPRYMFYWYYSPEGYDVVQSAISAEVDADKGELKSLYYGNMELGHRGPPIDVPLLLPPLRDTNPPPPKASFGARPAIRIRRPLDAFNPPQKKNVGQEFPRAFQGSTNSQSTGGS